MADCWICGLKFASNRDLKNHMMASHETMRVICPWCPDKKTYKRVTDLRSHMKGALPHQLAKYPADLISENNAIWFSLDPEGYRRLVKGQSGAARQRPMQECLFSSGFPEPAEVSEETTTGRWDVTT